MTREMVEMAHRKFEAAAKLLKELPREFSLYVANNTLHLMIGPSHDDKTGRPLHDNVVDTANGIRISGGDW